MKVIHCKDLDEIDKIRNKNGMYIEDEYGSKFTFKNNLLHSYNGKPAVEWRDGRKIWFRNGMFHRLYGHALEESSNGNKYWYLFGIIYSESDYINIMKNVPLYLWRNRRKL